MVNASRLGFSSLNHHLRTASEALTKAVESGKGMHEAAEFLPPGEAGALLRNSGATAAALLALLKEDRSVQIADLDLHPQQRVTTVAHRLQTLLRRLEVVVSDAGQNAHINGGMLHKGSGVFGQQAVRNGKVSKEAFQAAAERIYLKNIESGTVGRAVKLAKEYHPGAKGPADFDTTRVDRAALAAAVDSALNVAKRLLESSGAGAGNQILRELGRGGLISGDQAASTRKGAILETLAAEKRLPPALSAFRSLVSDAEIGAARRSRAELVLARIATGQFHDVTRLVDTEHATMGMPDSAIRLLKRYTGQGVITHAEAREAALGGWFQLSLRDHATPPTKFSSLEGYLQPTPAERVELVRRQAEALLQKPESSTSRFAALLEAKKWMPSGIYQAGVRDAAFYALVQGFAVPAGVLAELDNANIRDRSPTTMFDPQNGQGTFDLRDALKEAVRTPDGRKMARLFCDLIGPGTTRAELNACFNTLHAVVQKMAQPIGLTDEVDARVDHGRIIFGKHLPDVSAVLALREQVRNMLANQQCSWE